LLRHLLELFEEAELIFSLYTSVQKSNNVLKTDLSKSTLFLAASKDYVCLFF